MTTTAVSSSVPAHNQIAAKDLQPTKRDDVTGLRVLMFDDESNRDSVTQRLRAEAFEVTFASDPDDFIEELHASSPDAAIIDLQPSANQGLELLRRIRALEIQVPVVVMSDRGDAGVEATRLGAATSLAKPADFSELAQQIRRVIGSGRLPREMHLGDDGCPFELPPDGVDLEAVERGLLAQALVRTNGNQSRAARLLGISRYALRYRMQKFKLA